MGNPPNVLFYLSVKPQLFLLLLKEFQQLAISHNKNCRIVIEKPFGHDLESAVELNQLLMELFDEEQIYRIDHFLGKETVQNILALDLPMHFSNLFGIINT
jgi:glucose-6-phosphate 1-dehydrogenase